jgi:large subunit ribosomal protein L9
MKVLLIKDVYKLGRAGEIKKVADGFGRNFLIPKKLAIPASPGALKLAGSIGHKATELRAALNNELSSVADVLSQVKLVFSVKAGETGKLYGSVSPQMVVDEIKAKHNLDLDRHQVAMEPIRNLGEFKVPVHLTLDLVPVINVLVTREGEEVTSANPTTTIEKAVSAGEVAKVAVDKSIENAIEESTEVLVEEQGSQIDSKEPDEEVAPEEPKA